MVICQLPIPCNAGIGNRPIQLRADVNGTIPVLGRDAVIDGGQSAAAHADDATADHGGLATLCVTHAQVSVQHGLAHIQPPLLLQDLDLARVQPVAVFRTKGER